MANYERRRSQNRDWNDENNFRNRTSGYDRDYNNERDFRNPSSGRNFNQDYDDDRMSNSRGQSSNYDYQSEFGSEGGWDYGRGNDYGSSSRGYNDRNND